MNIEQFGQTIKAKHPVYQDMSDAEVGQKMLAKYPQYQDMVDGVGQQESAIPQYPLGSGKPGLSNFMQRLKLGFGGEKEKAQQQELEKSAGLKGYPDIGDIADVAGSALPIIGGFLGAAGGTVLGTPVGGIAGAGIGAGAGEAAKQAQVANKLKVTLNLIMGHSLKN